MTAALLPLLLADLAAHFFALQLLLKISGWALKPVRWHVVKERGWTLLQHLVLHVVTILVWAHCLHKSESLLPFHFLHQHLLLILLL